MCRTKKVGLVLELDGVEFVEIHGSKWKVFFHIFGCDIILDFACGFT